MHEPPGPHDPDRILMPALLAACPSFADTRGAQDAGLTEADGPLLYVDLGAFATHLVALIANNETSEFPAVFAAVERLFRDGDDGLRYALKAGLIEGIGNVASNQKGWPFAARFRAWLGPAATVAWNELHAEWGTSGTD